MATFAFNEDKLLVEVYSKAETDAKLAQKADTTWATNQLNSKASVSQVESLRLWTASQLNTKANASHTHPFSQISGLTFSLSGTTLTITKA